MLVLSRRPGESVMIGPNISVKVLGMQGPNVRLGFTAPKDVAINREEVAERIYAEFCEQMAQSGKPAPQEGNSHPPGTLHLRHQRRQSNTVDGNR